MKGILMTDSIMSPEDWKNHVQNFSKNFEQILSKIKDIKFKNELEQHLHIYIKHAFEIWRSEYKLVFIGPVGVGKSTAISHLFNLLIDNNDKSTILHTASGRTTTCQVTIQKSVHGECSINIIPYNNSEVIQIIKDFCSYYWNKEKNIIYDVKIVEEIARVIRNMASLGSSKDHSSREVIKDIINQSATESIFFNKIKERINLKNRTTTTIKYNSLAGNNWKEWLRNTFRDINNGKLPNISIPKEIIISIPDMEINRELSDYNLSIIDTKGIDNNTYREDLNNLIQEGGSIIIFCSTYSDAPHVTVRDVIQNMNTSLKVSPKNGKSLLLIIPKNKEGLQTTYDDGEQVETIEDGYKEKERQIRQELKENIEIVFYDKTIDGPNKVCSIISNQIKKYKNYHIYETKRFEKALTDAIQHSKKSTYRTTVKKVEDEISHFLERTKKLRINTDDISYKILNNYKKNHASSIWASVRRNGVYDNANFYYIAEQTISTVVNKAVEDWENKLNIIIKSMRDREELNDASSRILTIEEYTNEIKNKFIKNSGKNNISIYANELLSSSIWQDCSSEWGKGPGFKERVINHLQLWMNTHSNLQYILKQKLQEQWNSNVIDKILDTFKTR